MEAVNEKVENLAQEAADIASMRTRFGSEQFSSAFREASIQTVLTGEPSKIMGFAAVLGNSIVTEDWSQASSDLTSFIKAIAQLDEKDIHALWLLASIFADVVKRAPNMNATNAFTERFTVLLSAAQNDGFHLDDFYAHCRRLEGFGLATEVLRNPSRMDLDDYCFRPTRSA